MAGLAEALAPKDGFKRTVELKDKDNKLNGKFTYWTKYLQADKSVPKVPTHLHSICEVGDAMSFKKSEWAGKTVACFIGLKGSILDVCKIQVEFSDVPAFTTEDKNVKGQIGETWWNELQDD